MVALSASSSATVYNLHCNTNKLVGPTPMKLYPLSFISSSLGTNRSFAVRALDPQKQDQQKDSNLTAFTSKEDLDYLWKLAGGSVIGGAVIKYGSVVFPEITRPNITLALTMILSPVIVAILLLTYLSSKEQPK